ncbi:MAG: alpha/beta hydrolase [Rhodospirillaceae bacterium]|nr:alpha/beta hydrolase [Rhodospirillaceae bacterium]
MMELTRRATLATSAAVATVSIRPTHAATGKTYVLVHGAWHGGWCWREVAAKLRQAGHAVFTPTLAGMGERAHLMSPAVNLSTHAADIVNVIEWEELTDVILVGHSYSCHVISLVADRLKPRLRHLVFLDGTPAREAQAFIPAAAAAERRKTAREGYLLDPPPVTNLGIPDGHPQAAWVKRRMTAHTLNGVTEIVRFQNGGHAGVAKTFIRCTAGRAGQPDPVADMIKADPEWAWRTIDTGHDAMITAPDELSAMLLAIT